MPAGLKFRNGVGLKCKFNARFRSTSGLSPGSDLACGLYHILRCAKHGLQIWSVCCTGGSIGRCDVRILDARMRCKLTSIEPDLIEMLLTLAITGGAESCCKPNHQLPLNQR